jgi:hypothetical protein
MKPGPSSPKSDLIGSILYPGFHRRRLGLSLCREFENWYNVWRPHMTLEGLRPDDFYYDRKPETPDRKAKTVRGNIERHVFLETRLTAYCLKAAA